MPELPDITVYVERLTSVAEGATLSGVRLKSPFLLRSVEPPMSSVSGRRVVGVRRLGKRIVIGLEGELFLVLHLMMAGRLHWKKVGRVARPSGVALAAFDFRPGAWS